MLSELADIVLQWDLYKETTSLGGLKWEVVSHKDEKLSQIKWMQSMSRYDVIKTKQNKKNSVE